MMDFSGYDAYIRRGDSESITVSCDDDDFFEAGDVMYLTVRPSVDGDVTLRKIVSFSQLESGNAIFKFAPADTQSLPIGIYVWDIEMKKADGSCFHIIPPNAIDNVPKFIITGDVTE